MYFHVFLGAVVSLRTAEEDVCCCLKGRSGKSHAYSRPSSAHERCSIRRFTASPFVLPHLQNKRTVHRHKEGFPTPCANHDGRSCIRPRSFPGANLSTVQVDCDTYCNVWLSKRINDAMTSAAAAVTARKSYSSAVRPSPVTRDFCC